MSDKIKKQIEIKNRRAQFDYFFLDRYTAGIVLTGTEIKSIRMGKAGLSDTYCYINKGEVWVKNMYIAQYFWGSFSNHESRRDRKLLLNRKEIRKLESEMKNPGFTLVPIRLFIDGNSRAKVEVALARGKKQYDKRESIKERSDKRDMDRSFKDYNR